MTGIGKHPVKDTWDVWILISRAHLHSYTPKFQRSYILVNLSAACDGESLSNSEGELQPCSFEMAKCGFFSIVNEEYCFVLEWF